MRELDIHIISDYAFGFISRYEAISHSGGGSDNTTMGSALPNIFRLAYFKPTTIF